jgi:hypothetical protein
LLTPSRNLGAYRFDEIAQPVVQVRNAYAFR